MGPEAVRSEPPPPFAIVAAEPRDELRRLARIGWLCVIVGVLITPLELLAVAAAVRLVTRDRLAHGIPMLVVGMLLFGVSAALYLG
jgi:hypothetical protein